MSNRFYILVAFIAFSFTVSFAQSRLKIVDKKVDFGMRTVQNRKIDVIIIHSAYNSIGGEEYDVDLLIKQFELYRVSSHYVIGREGNIYQLVKEKNISFQAGRSSLPDGRTAVNSCSIGIELVTTKEEAPTEPQISALAALVKDIQKRQKIKYVLRHSDIAPERKTDPWNMDWEDFLKRIEWRN